MSKPKVKLRYMYTNGYGVAYACIPRPWWRSGLRFGGIKIGQVRP